MITIGLRLRALLPQSAILGHNCGVICLVITVVVGSAAVFADLLSRAFNDFHAVLRANGLDIAFRDRAEVGAESFPQSYVLDPPTAGTLRVSIVSDEERHGIAFEVSGIAEIVLASDLRALARSSIGNIDADISITRIPG